MNGKFLLLKGVLGKEAAVHAPMQTPMGRHISCLNEQQNTKMRKLFITAYTVAKHNLAFRTFSTLCMMLSLNNLMYLSIDGPSVQEFDLQPAIDYWASKSLRVHRPDYVRNN